MTTLSRIRAKIIEAVPEIQSFCSACDADGTHCSSCGGDGLDAPRPITLADVLRAMAKREGDASGRIWIDEDGRIMRGQGLTSVRWNLALSLDDQEPKVHDFIAKVLGV